MTMKRLSRTLAALALATGMSLSLSGCEFLDNIFCDLLHLPTCGDAGDIVGDGFNGGPRPRQANHIGEATP
jgi:hypothetical protein